MQRLLERVRLQCMLKLKCEQEQYGEIWNQLDVLARVAFPPDRSYAYMWSSPHCLRVRDAGCVEHCLIAESTNLPNGTSHSTYLSSREIMTVGEDGGESIQS